MRVKTVRGHLDQRGGMTVGPALWRGTQVGGMKPRTHHEVLSIVERGWRGARECSLSLSAEAIPVTHLIKGVLTREVQTMIRPAAQIRLVSVPRPVFRLRLWATLVWRTLAGRVGWLLVDHERTLHEVSAWCRTFSIRPVLIRELDDGYELWAGDKRVSLEECFGAVRAPSEGTSVPPPACGLKGRPTMSAHLR